jgi:hypothetical protein
VSNLIQHSKGHSNSFTSSAQLFNEDIFQSQTFFFFLIILTIVFFSILSSGNISKPSIIKSFQVKNIPQTFALANSISTSFGSSIQVIIFSILSVI